MTQKHKNAEYIIAFANGEEVEWHYSSVDFAYDHWQEVLNTSMFDSPDVVFRMKPKTITTKGYKRYAYKQVPLGNWLVDTFIEGSNFKLTDREVLIDKEWQYHVIEEKE